MRTATQAARALSLGEELAPGEDDLLAKIELEIEENVDLIKSDFDDLFAVYSAEDVGNIIGTVIALLAGTYSAEYGEDWIKRLDCLASLTLKEKLAEKNAAPDDPGFNGQDLDFASIAAALGLSPTIISGNHDRISDETGVAPAIVSDEGTRIAPTPVRLTDEQSIQRCNELVEELSKLSEPDAGTILTYTGCRLGEVKFGSGFIDKLLTITSNLRRV